MGEIIPFKRSEFEELISMSFECDCGGEILNVVDNTEIKGKEHFLQEFQFAIFGYGLINPKPDLWERIRYAWWHLRTGKKYLDEIVLRRETAKRLAEFILDRYDDPLDIVKNKRYKIKTNETDI